MDADDLSGQLLDGRYQVIEQIGEGAMGHVYRGERVKLGRAVAIKVMNERLPDEMASRKRFEREAMAMAKLEHPHCASVLDIGVHDKRPYVVMDFVSGVPLTKLVEAGPVPIARAVEITRQVLSGLAHAHELGIVHRDIKPANVMLSQKAGLGDHVKILDFGLAKLNEESSNLTAGVVLGTPSYMAPEQVRGQLLDGRTDLYACGIMLFELLTGTKPFRLESHDPLGICMMHINTPPPTLAERVPGRDFGALEAIVARALEKDRDRRIATANDFAALLAEVASVRSVATPPRGVPAGYDATGLLPSVEPQRQQPPPSELSQAPSSSMARPSSRRPIAIIAGVVGVVVIIAIIAATRGSKTPTPTTPTTPTTPSAASGAMDDPAAVADDDPVALLVARARQMSHRPAIDMLLKARKTYPDDARIPFAAGLLYLDKMYFADGLPLVRSAIALDATLRSDDALIKDLIRGFNATASYDSTIAAFLRDEIGDAAKPYLEETAKSHPNPIVRNRATAELRRY